MEIQPIIFILLVASILGLSVVILFIIQSYNHLIKKIEQGEEEKIHLHDSINQKASELLQEAHTENLRIIEEANKQASDIVGSAKISKASAEDTLKKILNDLIALQQQTIEQLEKQFTNNYQETLQKIQSKDIVSFQNISKGVEETVSEEMQTFTKILKEETVDAHAIMQDRVEHEYAKVEEDIERYKEEQFKKVEQAVTPLLKNVISLVIGRTLSLTDHEQLIIESIREARSHMPEFQEARGFEPQPAATISSEKPSTPNAQEAVNSQIKKQVKT